MGPPISTWPFSHPARADVTSRSDKVLQSEHRCLFVQFVDNFRVVCYNFTFAILLVQVFLSLNYVKAGPVILNLDYLQGPVPLARNIRHLPCISRRTGQEGLCMFAIDCLKANGSHLGTCIDRFYFGSCCQIPDKTVLPQIIGNNIEDNSIDSASFVHPQTEDKIHSTVSKIPSLIPNRNTTTERMTEVTTDKAETVQDRTDPIELETKSDADREISKLTTPLETTTKSKLPSTVTEIPLKLSTFQTVSGDISNLATEVSKTTEVVKETQTAVAITPNPIKVTTKKTTKPTYRPKPTFRPSNFTRPHFTATTSKPRPTRPPSIFNSTRKPPYKLPPKRTTTKKPLPSPPRLNITIIPQSTSIRPYFTRPSVPSITYINATVTPEEKISTSTSTTTTTTPTTTTTQSTTITPSTLTTPSTTTTISTTTTTTTEPTTILVTERLTEAIEYVTESLASSSEIITETVAEKITYSEASESSILVSSSTQSFLTEKPSVTSPESTLSETLTSKSPVQESSASEAAVIESSSSEAAVLESSSSESPPSESPPLSESSSTLNEPLPEPESIPTVSEKITTPAVEKETLKPVAVVETPLTTMSVVSTEFPPLVTWSTVDAVTKTPENSTIISDDKWSPITPPVGWVLISTIPPTTTTEVATSSLTTTEQPLTHVPTTVQTTQEQTDVEEKLTTSSTEQATIPTVSTVAAPTIITTPDAITVSESTVTQQPVLEFTVNVTLSPTVPTSTASVPSTEATVPDKTSQNTTENVVANATEVSTTLDVANATTVAPPTTSEGPSFNMSNYKEVCGRRLWPQARIVGGKNSAFGQWPWQISLRQYRTSTYLHKCGAALLNENWAITAAHCVEHVPPSELLVRLGEHDLANDKEPYEFAERRVQIIASHPHFDPATFEYDLALLRFYEPVTFRPNILPVCVPDDDDDFVGKTAFVTGWGRLFDDGPLPSVLQEVRVPVINNSLCEAMYQDAGYNEHIPNIFICAGRRQGGADSCEGDSGGPMVLQRERDNRFVLGGVISWGIGCAEPNQPGVYTRISEFRDWINQILQF